MALLTVGMATPSAFAGLHKEFSIFNDCPVTAPKAATCVVSTTTSGEFHLGSKTVPVTKTVLLQGALAEGSKVLIPAADGETLSKTPLEVPGGIIGIEILGPLTGVTATAELAGAVEIDPTAANTAKGTAAVLPLKVKLDHPLLGSSCYVGSDSEPIDLNLTTGTTSPPGPNTPISGSPGTPAITGHGKIVTINGSSLVDNAFAAPGANGCAGLLAAVVDPAVDLQTGLPAAAGKNTAILNGSLAVAGVRSVVADRALPEIGRCTKVTGEKVGKTTFFHGGYVDSGCIEESLPHFGQYEWTPGPGAAAGFTESSAGVTLESVGHSRIKCTASHGSGTYTGPKTASLGITFTGCTNLVSKATCASAGSAAGEIAASGLQANLGFIKDESTPGGLVLSVGWDLANSPTVLSATCGSEAVSVSGSAIGAVTPIDKPVAATVLKYVQAGGKQAPESFEEEPKDVLAASFGAGAPQQAGLNGALKFANQEKLEIKAEAEE